MSYEIENIFSSNGTTIILRVLFTIQILIGIIILINTELLNISINKYFQETQIKDYLIELYGIHLIIFYLCGLGIVSKLKKNCYTNHLSILLKLWNIVIVLLSIDGIVTSWISYKSIYIKENLIEKYLYKGIEEYYSDLKWKLIWDRLQLTEGCCGVLSFKDWNIMTWKEVILGDMKEE